MYVFWLPTRYEGRFLCKSYTRAFANRPNSQVFVTVDALIFTLISLVPQLIKRFGCCSDGETAAGGPNGELCDERRECKNDHSPFGCCPDGFTFAQGPKKQGCFSCPPEVRF